MGQKENIACRMPEVKKMGYLWDDGVKPITTTIPMRVYKLAKSQHWKHSETYLMGIQARQGNKHLVERIAELEKQAEAYKQDYFRLKKLFLKSQEAAADGGAKA